MHVYESAFLLPSMKLPNSDCRLIIDANLQLFCHMHTVEFLG